MVYVTHKERDGNLYVSGKVRIEALSPVTIDKYLINFKVKVNETVVICYCERYFKLGNEYVLRDDDNSWMVAYGEYKIKKNNGDLFREMSLEETGLETTAYELHHHIRKFLKKRFEEQLTNGE